MVIQRNWKVQSENSSINNNNNNINTNNSSNNNVSNINNDNNNNIINNSNFSSSEDSNSSTISSSKGQNSNFVTTPHMAENVLLRLKQRFGTGLMGQKSCHEAEVVMRSLELLRINIQTAFDREIDDIVKKFMETYFQPAFKNIKENLGDHVVSDEILIKMSCALIENSKTQYNTRPIISTPGPQQQSKNILILTKNTMTGQPQSGPSTTVPKSQTTVLKRPSNDNPTSVGTNVPVVKKPLILQQRIINPQLITQQRRQIFWNTANITTETRFLLDVQANQAFGFGTDGRERLASKHPELIRYLPDAQDRDWLVQQKIIPSQNRNSRFLFLVYEEVMKLGELEVYKKRENLNLSILHAFKIPNFVIQKMKLFFIDLNIKSRGLITNSYSTTGNSSSAVDKITTTSTTVNTTSGSQLRNALLQGSNASSIENGNQQRQQHQQQQQPPQKLVTTTVLTPKPKSSLSSSHATLTALLNSNNNSNDS